LHLELVETPDIVATLGAIKKPHQWVVGFALETQDVRFRAIVKMSKKCCDMIVSNRAEAMNSESNSVEVLLRGGHVLEQINGPKLHVARGILALIDANLIANEPTEESS
jgi:phosphopantothenoylcysteine decarboxylase/phosphopantothenate--cysteine ligase